MDDDIAIRVEHVSKDFSLPHERNTSIKQAFLNPFRSAMHKNVSKQHALKDISFEIKKGEFFGIVGRNGSGKSTLLKLLAGIYQPTKGNLKTTGKLVPFIELGVGFNPELTGRQNVYLNGALLGFSEKEVSAMYDDIVEFAELEKFMDQKLKNYSSGMQVRLAFSMAVRAKADILLIDEVLAVGDADFQRKCFEYFKRLKQARKTVVFVSHDMGAVREFCDRAMLIEENKLVGMGSPEKIARAYTKLFVNDGSLTSTHSAPGKRWGDKTAVYKNLRTEVVDQGRNILLSVQVKATENISDPTFGFMICNEAKQSILGTNSTIERVPIESLLAGKTTSLQWIIPNIFNEGNFYIELVLMYASITKVADWWESAGVFSVENDKRTPYLVNPPIIFSRD